MKKIFSLVSLVLLSAVLLVGCGGNKGSNMINVVSREDGSGTRGAFVELFKVEEAVNGKKTDQTTKEATVVSKTDVMITTIVNDPNAIGYISLGSLNNTVKALDIDGVKASAANVKNKTYKIARPFIIATKGDATGLTKDFIDYILSAEGQAVVGKSGYIAVNETPAPYKGSKPAGKIVVAGSSSVTPVMEKLKEAYIALNPNASIEVQMSDSTAGMTGAINGTCNIGMASRALKSSEKQALQGTEIALDGIAVIVNTKNPASALASADIKNIFTGKVTKWSDVVK